MKLNFFAKLYLAITDFRLYPYIVQKEKFLKCFLYFFEFIVLISAILSFNVTTKISNWLTEFVTEYNEQVEDFNIEDGIFTAENNMDFDFLNVKVYTDDSKSLDEVDIRLLNLDDFRFSILVFKDAVLIGNSGQAYSVWDFKESKININKQELYVKLNNILENSTYKVIAFLVLFMSIFIVLFISKFIFSLLITLLLIIIGMIFKLSYKFKDYLKISFYIITLPTITQIIALLFIGEINDYASITYYLLCYVYMFYAVRALKLDNILIETQQKIMDIRNESEKAKTILDEEKSKTSKENKEENDKEKDDNKDNDKNE